MSKFINLKIHGGLGSNSGSDALYAVSANISYHEKIKTVFGSLPISQKFKTCTPSIMG